MLNFQESSTILLFFHIAQDFKAIALNRCFVWIFVISPDAHKICKQRFFSHQRLILISIDFYAVGHTGIFRFSYSYKYNSGYKSGYKSRKFNRNKHEQ